MAAPATDLISDTSAGHWASPMPRNLPLLLLRAREAVLGHFRPELQSVGLTEQQWRVLRALHDHDGLEQRALGRLCQISSPSLTGILARMEALNLVRRECMDIDLRRRTVHTTEASRQVIRTLLPRLAARYARLEAAIGRDELEGVYRVLDRLLERVDPPA